LVHPGEEKVEEVRIPVTRAECDHRAGCAADSACDFEAGSDELPAPSRLPAPRPGPSSLLVFTRLFLIVAVRPVEASVLPVVAEQIPAPNFAEAMILLSTIVRLSPSAVPDGARSAPMPAARAPRALIRLPRIVKVVTSERVSFPAPQQMPAAFVPRALTWAEAIVIESRMEEPVADAEPERIPARPLKLTALMKLMILS
jgi:hypothetical protein